MCLSLRFSSILNLVRPTTRTWWWPLCSKWYSWARLPCWRLTRLWLDTHTLGRTSQWIYHVGALAVLAAIHLLFRGPSAKQLWQEFERNSKTCCDRRTPLRFWDGFCALRCWAPSWQDWELSVPWHMALLWGLQITVCALCGRWMHVSTVCWIETCCKGVPFDWRRGDITLEISGNTYWVRKMSG